MWPLVVESNVLLTANRKQWAHSYSHKKTSSKSVNLELELSLVETPNENVAGQCLDFSCVRHWAENPVDLSQISDPWGNKYTVFLSAKLMVTCYTVTENYYSYETLMTRLHDSINKFILTWSCQLNYTSDKGQLQLLLKPFILFIFCIQINEILDCKLEKSCFYQNHIDNLGQKPCFGTNDFR